MRFVSTVSAPKLQLPELAWLNCVRMRRNQSLAVSIGIDQSRRLEGYPSRQIKG